MTKKAPKYQAKTVERIRYTILFTEEEIAEIDEFGFNEEMPDRAKAIRALIKKGLEK